MGRSATGTLSDRDIVDYLSSRAYVECTDSGNEDPNRFDTHMYPGNFRHQISMHIITLKQRELAAKTATATPTPLTMDQVEERLKGRD